EVWVVVADSVRLRVDIVDPEARLAVNQHPGEVDPIAIVELEDLFEEVEFGLAVEAVVIEVEGPVPVADVVGEVPAGDQVRFGSESEGRSLVGGGAVPLHQLDLLLFW